ncbi:MAG TPA: hypothetical protein VGE06_02640 [Flavisolibacter sp.]
MIIFLSHRPKEVKAFDHKGSGVCMTKPKKTGSTAMNLRNVTLAAILTFTLTAPALSDESKLIPTPAAKKEAPKKPKLDADGDGRTSLQEHLDWQKRYFEKIDADGDGFITKEERSAYNTKKATAAAAKEEPKKGFFGKILGD